jgi:hypothetical protein
MKNLLNLTSQIHQVSRGGPVRALNFGESLKLRPDPGSKHGTLLEQSLGGVSPCGRFFFKYQI